jgi:hypothetical protein
MTRVGATLVRAGLGPSQCPVDFESAMLLAISYVLGSADSKSFRGLLDTTYSGHHVVRNRWKQLEKEPMTQLHQPHDRGPHRRGRDHGHRVSG